MTLFTSSFSTSLVLLALGLLFLVRRNELNTLILNFPRSSKLSYIFITIALLWFLYRHVSNLSEADFGNYKVLIGTISVGIAIGSFFFVRDFLAVRGLAILGLFFSREVLDAAFLEEPQSRLFVVTIIYIIVIAALYFGAWPYRMRDFLEWLYANDLRKKILGFTFSLIGLVIGGIAFSY